MYILNGQIQYMGFMWLVHNIFQSVPGHQKAARPIKSVTFIIDVCFCKSSREGEWEISCKLGVNRLFNNKKSHDCLFGYLNLIFRALTTDN